MRVAAGLIVAPLLALADQGVAYVLAGWSCAHQQEGVPHAVHAAFLAAALVATFLAWTTSREALHEVRETGFSANRHDALALCALAVGVLSATIIVALWIPQWILSPCFG